MDLDRIKKRIKDAEGYSNAPYKCPSGFMTIGYGWNMDVNPLPQDIETFLEGGGFITPSHAERLLNISVQRASSGCRGIWAEFDSFPTIIQEALVELVYNMGANGVEQGFPKFCDAVDAQDWARAHDELKHADGEKKGRLSKCYTHVKDRRARAILAMFE